MHTEVRNNFYSKSRKAGEEFQTSDYGDKNHLLFLLSGEMKVNYGNLYPRNIQSGNMLLLTPLSNYICHTLTPVEMIVLEFDTLAGGCDKFIFQFLSPIYTLIKYEFQELEIREPLKKYLSLIQSYLKVDSLSTALCQEKMKELFILLRAYYDTEEFVRLFYPLLGKNMEFRKMITDNYLRVKNASEYADLCGYSLGAFQRKFKDVFGETVYQWMQKQKAEQIKHRLMATEVSLKELSEDFDFASPAHLNKFCKIWFGMTPTELRQTYLLRKKLR